MHQASAISAPGTARPPAPTWLGGLLAWRDAAAGPDHDARAMLGNGAWLVLDRVFRALVTLPVTLWTARYLGVVDFGKLNYATTLVALLAVGASLGLEGVVVRALVRTPASAERILGSAFCLTLGSGLLSFALALALAATSSDGDADGAALIAIAGASLLLQALDVIDYRFRSQWRSGAVVRARLAALSCATLVRVALVLGGFGLRAFAAVSVLEALLGAAGLALAYRAAGWRLHRLAPDLACMRDLLQAAWPLLLSALAVSLYMRLDLIMIRQLAGPHAAGVYAAAVRLSELWYAVPMLAPTMPPALLRSRESDRSRYLRQLRRLYAALAWLAIAIAVPLARRRLSRHAAVRCRL